MLDGVSRTKERSPLWYYIAELEKKLVNYEALQAENTRLKQRVAELEASTQDDTATAHDLHTSEERYRLLVETSPYAISLVGIDGTILMCNQSKADLLDLSHPLDLVGKDVRTLIAPEYQQFAEELWQRALREGHIRNVRYEMMRPRDSSRIFVESSASVIWNADGTPQGFLNISRDITEQIRHERERDAIITVAAALRAASDRANMIPILLDQVMKLLNTDSALLCLFEPECREVVIELGRGTWENVTGVRLPLEERAYLPQVLEGWLTEHAPTGEETSTCVSFIAHEHIIGAICVGCQRPIAEADQRLLSAIGDMVANALHRMRLHEQTRRRLNYLDALHTIDHFINASLDLHETLQVLLDQVIIQLNVDAAAVLLFNPVTEELEYASGSGFYSDAIARSRLHRGDGYAGQVALENRVLCIPDVWQEQSKFRADVLEQENIRTYYGVPLVAKGAIKGVLEIFHRTLFEPDQEWLNFLDMLAGQAAIAIDNAEMFAELERTNDDLILAYDATIEGWARALELRDVETEGHSRRVTDLTLRLALLMGFSNEDLVHVRRGALLHDIGKMALPDSILLKPGPLSAEENYIMQQHPIYAYNLLYPIPFLRPALDIPYYHHEKWDGTGYPCGLKGDAIPLAARIFAVVDVYDALCSDRPYRNGWKKEQAYQYIREEAGKHFDPEVVANFFRLMEQKT
jgi:PAS domain S-box-containing protein